MTATVGLLSGPAAAQVGTFSDVLPWAFIPIHSSLLPDGKVMTFGAKPNDGQGGFDFDLWDPTKGTGPDSHLQLPNVLEVDSFCAGAVLRSDNSKLMIVGGNSNERVTEFGYKNARAGLTVMPSMTYPRYYATVTTLPSGQTLVTGGSPSYGNQTNASPISEVLTPGAGWRELPGTENSPMRRADMATSGNPFWYPHIYTTSADEVFVLAGRYSYYVDHTGDGSIRDVRPVTGNNWGATSTGVLYRPGLALQIGGGSYGNNTPDNVPGSDMASIFDLRPRIATSRDTRMRFKRHWPTAVVLPNGEVLVVGGAEGNNTLENVAYAAEIFNPDTEQWRVDASMQTPRLYHSTALLMKDGRVLVGGGGAPGPIAGRNAEVYTPAFLLDRTGKPAPRPSILAGPVRVALGQTFRVQADKTIRRMTFVKTGTVTHGWNTDQRFFEAAWTPAGDGYDVTFPDDAINATPGLYMLFAFDEAGVPSEGKYMRLPSPTGDDGTDIPSDTPTSPAPAGTLGGGTPQGPVGWARCASESQMCRFDGLRTVRFGANGTYATREATNEILCSTDTFGRDPVFGTLKFCEYQTAADPAPTPEPATPQPEPTPPAPQPSPQPDVPQPTAPASTAGWTRCASENETCRFEGVRQVRYGANGIYATRVMVSLAACNTATFGRDPVPGTIKVCDVESAGAPAPTPTQPAPQEETAGTWARCASENETCRFEGVRQVRYGAKGVFATRVMVNVAACDTATFGRDPVPGTIKACDVASADTPAPQQETAGTWARCASENEVCRFDGVRRVRYGIDGLFVTREMRNTAACNTATFGLDPAFGRIKICDVESAGAAAPTQPAPQRETAGTWARCATEGYMCAFDGVRKVRYGIDGRFVTRDLRKPAACKTATFGRDPAPGRIKVCEIQMAR
ncbi:galactose oxidase-like domain-containing protein [Aureimonas sp. Leaf454]|uniref:galactose oxidase-like domain-containing protein n=1 Tax=Aureimonas sp. Leaf454 TaxID=1736381 RepID=UPI00138F96AB|nr:galactose oxidase-like domain-containing protein [Aureimonas sp. Leaf454]